MLNELQVVYIFRIQKPLQMAVPSNSALYVYVKVIGGDFEKACIIAEFVYFATI